MYATRSELDENNDKQCAVTPPQIGKIRIVVHYTLTGLDLDTACQTAVGYPWMLLTLRSDQWRKSSNDGLGMKHSPTI